MSMDLAQKTFTCSGKHLIAGTAKIVTATKETAVDLKCGAPVVLDASGKLAAITATEGKVTTDGLYGIMAEDAVGGEAGIVYLSGEFFADALVLPDGASVSDVEVALRNIGIFLK